MEEAEDQYQMALRTQLNNVDALIKLHDSRLYALERSFHQELRKVEDDFMKEKEAMLIKFKHEKKMLTAIIEAVEKEEEDRENEVQKKCCVSFSLITVQVSFIFIHFSINVHTLV